MTVQQFQLRHSAVEDRIIISVEDTEAGRREFALTRRLVQRLWPGLSEVMREARERVPDAPSEPVLAETPAKDSGPESTPGNSAAPVSAIPADGAPAATPAATQGRPEGASADVPTPAAAPGGDAPPPQRYLVRRVRILSRKPDTRVLVLSDGMTTLNVPLSPRQLIDTINALKAIIERAEWAIDTTFDWERPDAEAPAERRATAKIDIHADSPSRFRH